MRFILNNNKNSPFSSAYKHNHVFVKFVVCVLILGLAYRLLSSTSIQFFSDVGTDIPPVVDNDNILPPPVGISPFPDDFPVNENPTTQIGDFPVNQRPATQNGDFPVNENPTTSQIGDFPVNEIPTTQNDLRDEANAMPPPVGNSPSSNDFPVNESPITQNVTGKCDIFRGDWVPDTSAPFYTNKSCHFIDANQDCMTNGRPDTQYLYWRWVPRDCKLPKFNSERFLHLARDKSWGFIGDSISRNHGQSLLCMLSQVEEATEIYHDEEYKSRTWYFPHHNFTLAIIWAPLLAKTAIFEDNNGVSSAAMKLHIDKLDAVWTEQYKKLDYALIAGGKWIFKPAIYYENDTVVGCHNCTGKNLTVLGFDDVYRKVLRLSFDFVTSSNRKVNFFFRMTAPDHFEGGEWHSGGYCTRTMPFKEGEVNMSYVDTIMHSIELEEFEKAKAAGSRNGMSLKLLNTANLSLLRPDGHPGAYRQRQFQLLAKDKNAKVPNDCLHWCLPGPIDSWNDLLMEMLVNGQD
ncbi:protein trichome birefringence-like 24 isoform X2 [Cornus florida]|nr:protein trichome birefringence-like 24 isoform X2 [Cornus florida]